MIDFLLRPVGRWALRLLAVVIGWLFATKVLGMAGDGDGHVFLMTMVLIVTLSAAAFLLFPIEGYLGLLAIRRRADAAMSKNQRHTGPVPPLSQAKQAQVRRMHKALVAAGVFAPEVPQVELAFAELAVRKEKVTWLALLGAFENAHRYHPDCDPTRWLANLAYDHIPQAWLQPPPGKVAAFLWEDDNHAFSLVEESHLPKLEKEEAGGPGWGQLTEEMVQLFEQAKVFAH